MKNEITVIIIGEGEIRSPILRNFLQKFDNDLDVHHIYFDGGNASIRDFFHYQKHFYRERSGLLTPGEYGCLMSHIKAYDLCKHYQRPVLILEDDAEPKKYVTPSFLRSIIDHCEPADVIHLGVQNGLSTYFATEPKSLWSVPRGFPIWRTAAYFVGQTAASNLIEFQNSHTKRADEWNAFTDANILNLKYLDCFDHPIDKGEKMELDRKGASLQLRDEVKRAIRRRFKHFLKFKTPQPQLINKIVKN